MADKQETITQPAAIDNTTCTVTREAGVTKLFFVYVPPQGPARTQTSLVLDSQLTAQQRTDLNSGLLAAYNVAKAAMGF